MRHQQQRQQLLTDELPCIVLLFYIYVSHTSILLLLGIQNVDHGVQVIKCNS